jgi:hypothetical protein
MPCKVAWGKFSLQYHGLRFSVFQFSDSGELSQAIQPLALIILAAVSTGLILAGSIALAPPGVSALVDPVADHNQGKEEAFFAASAELGSSGRNCSIDCRL